MPDRKPKKVAFLITKSNWGGAQRYVFDIASNLPDHFEVVVIHGGNGALVEKLKAATIRTIAIPSLQRDISFKKELQSLRELKTILKREQPDILHINSSKAGLYGGLLGRFLHIPQVIFTAHGWSFNEDRPLWQRVILKVLHYITVLSAHKTIAVSNGLKNQLRWFGTTRKMTVINPARAIIQLYDPTTARNILLSKAQLGNTVVTGEIWIGTIAELHPIKRLDNALTAISQLIETYPNLRYFIIGTGELYSDLANQIHALGLQDRVFLLGHIDEAATLLPAFDIFLLPSKSESYGYVLLEAGQAGLPSISSNVGGIPDLIKDGKNGLLVTPDNQEALIEALQTLVNNPTLRHTLGTDAKRRASEKTIAAMIDATIKLYDSNNS